MGQQFPRSRHRYSEMLKYTDYDIVFSEIPDEVTLALNISGCPHRCSGCHSPQLQTDIGEPLTEQVLTSLIERYRPDITCICFMGGDCDPSEIARLSAWIHEMTSVPPYGNISCRGLRHPLPPLHTGWYSGNALIAEGFDIKKSRLDYIKLGPYIAELGPLNRETTNQRLYRICADGELADITFRLQRSKK